MPSGGEFALLGNATGNRGPQEAAESSLLPGRANVRQGRAGRLGAEIDLSDKWPARGRPFVLHNAVSNRSKPSRWGVQVPGVQLGQRILCHFARSPLTSLAL